MERILPIGPDGWESVVQEHSETYPGCDVDSIRRKFTSMYRKKIPIGDPNMPVKVRMVKRVKYLIGDRASIGGGTEEYDMEQNRFGVVDAAKEVASLVVNANPAPEDLVNRNVTMNNGSIVNNRPDRNEVTRSGHSSGTSTPSNRSVSSGTARNNG